MKTNKTDVKAASKQFVLRMSLIMLAALVIIATYVKNSDWKIWVNFAVIVVLLAVINYKYFVLYNKLKEQ